MGLLNQFSDYDDSVSKNQPVYSGKLGLSISGARQVNVSGRGGFVYVRLRDNLSEVVQAYNDKVSPIYDFPVLIQRKGNRWHVIGKDTARYDQWSNYAPYLPAHASQHSFNRDNGTGGDKVDIYADQFMPLLVYPSGTAGAGMLMVAPYLLQRDADFIQVGNTGTRNLLIYKPTTNQAILGLVVLNKTTGNPEVIINSGTPFSAGITGTAGISPYIPYPQSHQEPLYAFRLVSGTRSLGWSNLYNARQLVGRGSASTGTSSGGGIAGIVAQDEGVVLGTGTVFNFVGPNVDASISGSVVRVFVTGSSGGSLPTFITGSIPYAASDGTLTENNPLLFWDNTVRGLRLGRNRNISPFNVADGFSIAVGGNNPGDISGIAGLTLGTGSLGSPSFTVNGYRARGTGTTVMQPVQSGDALASWIGAGYDGANFQSASRVRLYADGSWITGTYYPTRIDFEITPSGSATRRAQATLRGDSLDLVSGSTYNIGGTPHTHNDKLDVDSLGQVDIGETVAITDDNVYSFTPSQAAGLILIQSRSAATTNYLFAFYVTTAGGSFSPTYSIGSNTVTTTGALTGTTGTDGRLTCSVNTANGKIYVENRTGASRNVVIKSW